MKFENWLKRKYPNHYKELQDKFKKYELDYLKTFKYKVGILNVHNGKNKIGDLCLYHLGKEYGEDYNGLYSYDTGWTGAFEYTFIYQKEATHWCTKSYVAGCDEVKPYQISREKE